MNPNPRKCSNDKLTVYRSREGLWVVKDPRRWGIRCFNTHGEALQAALTLVGAA
jgi:hypothetical protein